MTQLMSIDFIEQERDSVNGCGIALSLLYNSQNLIMTYSVIYSCD